MDCSISNVGDKLQVGIVPTDFPGLGSKLVPGTAVINGPVYIGAALQGGVPTAACMIGPPLPNVTFPASLDVKGISLFTGVTNTAGIINDLALSNVFGFTSRIGAIIGAALNLDNGIKIQSAVNISQGPKVCQAVTTTPLVKADEGIFTSIKAAGGVMTGVNIEGCTGKKNFDIPHPTKEGWRLRHVCIEGPSADVYVRGKLKDSNVIELPEYWRKLVDPETITVNLTSIGAYQELYVDEIEWGTRITIKTNSGSSINCYYTVYGERVDTDKNIPEYEGTYDDYPGDNKQYTQSAIVQ